jgi:hypothetical protein
MDRIPPLDWPGYSRRLPQNRSGRHYYTMSKDAALTRDQGTRPTLSMTRVRASVKTTGSVHRSR